jgi:hypothetical protein
MFTLLAIPGAFFLCALILHHDPRFRTGPDLFHAPTEGDDQ